MHPCILWQIANGTALLGEGAGRTSTVEMLTQSSNSEYQLAVATP